MSIAVPVVPRNPASHDRDAWPARADASTGRQVSVAAAVVPATAPTTNPPAPGWRRVPTGRPPGSPRSPTTAGRPRWTGARDRGEGPGPGTGARDRGQGPGPGTGARTRGQGPGPRPGAVRVYRPGRAPSRLPSGTARPCPSPPWTGRPRDVGSPQRRPALVAGAGSGEQSGDRDRVLDLPRERRPDPPVDRHPVHAQIGLFRRAPQAVRVGDLGQVARPEDAQRLLAHPP